MDCKAISESFEKERDALVERLLASTGGTFDIFTMYIGDRLGFYRSLGEDGPATSDELAARTGAYERYVREWLEQQTVAGILTVEDETTAAPSRRYRLPAGHKEVLLDRDSLNFLAPLVQMVVGAVRPIYQVLKAYRSGRGVPYPYYGVDFREGQAGMNRAMFLRQLGSEWLPSISDVHQRLMADPPARVADIGCGGGWSSIGIAQAYPKVHVDGYDLDEPSVNLAQANVTEAGLSDRVSIHRRDAGDPSFGDIMIW